MSNFYSHTDVNAESKSAVFVAARPFAVGKGPAPKGIRSTLVDGTLVPNTFIKEVESQLIGARMKCSEAISVSDLFASSFLETLGPNESRVLGDVVFFLIDNGYVTIFLADKLKEAA
jgi:hypothetical protein